MRWYFNISPKSESKHGTYIYTKSITTMWVCKHYLLVPPLMYRTLSVDKLVSYYQYGGYIPLCKYSSWDGRS